MIAEKVELYFDQYSFNRAVTDYGRRKTIESKIREELKTLIGKAPKTIEEPIKYFYNELKKQNEELLALGVAIDKIPEIKGLNLFKLEELSRKFAAVKDIKSPNVEQFKIFAESEKEEARYNACIKVIKALEELQKHTKVFPANVQNATGGAITADMRKGLDCNSLYPNHRWIKNLRY